MKTCSARHSRGQLKIQEMAFVLIAIVVLFVLAGLFYIVVRGSSEREGVARLQEDEARELVRKIASTPEFVWKDAECSSCIDMDKVFALKDIKAYSSFWGVDLLRIEKVYPNQTGECNPVNYPNCGTITLAGGKTGSPPSAFVALCRQEFSGAGYTKCELGRIYAYKEVKS